MQRIAAVTAELHEFVALEGAPVVPVSAVTGEGMQQLKASISHALQKNQQVSP